MGGLGFAALLIRLPAGAASGLGLSGRARLRAAGLAFDLEPLFAVRRAGMRGSAAAEWHLAHPRGRVDGAGAWALAHQAVRSTPELAGRPDVLVEPDFIQEWLCESLSVSRAGILAVPDGAFNDQVAALPRVPGRFAWHLDADYTQLADARRRVGAPTGGRIRIAHLDTGYDPGHRTLPAHMALERNFVPGEPPDDARDPFKEGLLKNPGHGTGTLGILAGSAIAFAGPGYQPFDAAIGGAPEAEVVPVRVASSVVQIMTSGIARGIDYAARLCEDAATRVHVLSMSMGGVASRAWADAVNAAYDAGVVLVTAAGNNISAGAFGLPTRFIVHPARFRRVIAACGVMADRRAYYGLPVDELQGNWGPASKMATVISAFTPNIAWAEIGAPEIVDMSGAGTSSATPQVAAAAALYLQLHAAALLDEGRYPEPWMRVEAVRHALFSSADRSADGGSPDRIGHGVVQASRALDVAPLQASALRKTPEDRAAFAFLSALAGLGDREPVGDEM
ncbi:MAG: S8 family peptidase, partial [Candidatus Eiseniibacteriota bacterium]